MHTATIDLDLLSTDDVTEAPALAEGDSYHPVLVEAMPSGRYDVLDGFHRVAGLRASGASLVRVIVVDDVDLAAAVSEPGPEQDAAIEAIYDAVGYDPLFPDRSLWS